MAEYCVYIIANVTGMLYVGVTNNITRRVLEHKSKRLKGFTSRYNLTQLVYCETTPYVYNALTREKQLKGWTRKKKVELIKSMNPEWKDLSQEIIGLDNKQ
jgi:putative endonuclease